MCSFPKAFGTGRDFVLNKKCDKFLKNLVKKMFYNAKLVYFNHFEKKSLKSYIIQNPLNSPLRIFQHHIRIR